MAARGLGSLRERRPGVWEIRVAAGTDPVTGRTLQRSVTFHGTAGEAEVYRSELAAEYAARRSVTKAAPMLTVRGVVRALAAGGPSVAAIHVGRLPLERPEPGPGSRPCADPGGVAHTTASPAGARTVAGSREDTIGDRRSVPGAARSDRMGL